jgi:hypothetical protein
VTSGTSVQHRLACQGSATLPPKRSGDPTASKGYHPRVPFSREPSVRRNHGHLYASLSQPHPAFDRLVASARLRFWTTTAFPCPYCKRTLMPNGDKLYDISEGGFNGGNA